MTQLPNTSPRPRPLGSPLGWTLAAALALLYLGSLTLLELSARTTPPTPLSDRALLPLSLSLPFDRLPETPPRTPSPDATPLLIEIVRLVQADLPLYQRFTQSPSVPLNEVPRLAALDPLLEQAPLATANAWPLPPERHIAYRPEHPEVAALLLAGQSANRLAMVLRGQSQNADAARYFHATLSLGHKLFTHRTTYAELSAALGLMTEATAGLRLLHPDDPALAQLAQSLQSLTDDTNATWTAISTIDPDVLSLHNGDIPRIALASAEPVWRVEAVLKLGRLKYNVGTRGTPADQRRARRLIQQLQSDPDPPIALAARLANELTLEQYRTLR